MKFMEYTAAEPLSQKNHVRSADIDDGDSGSPIAQELELGSTREAN